VNIEEKLLHTLKYD
jgi:hypothetical protein